MTLTILMALGAYRLFRLQALDDLPPLVWLRTRVQDATAERFGEEWADGWACAWCSGFYWSALTVLVTMSFTDVPLPALQILAVSTIVGFLGSKLDA